MIYLTPSSDNSNLVFFFSKLSPHRSIVSIKNRAERIASETFGITRENLNTYRNSNIQLIKHPEGRFTFDEFMTRLERTILNEVTSRTNSVIITDWKPEHGKPRLSTSVKVGNKDESGYDFVVNDDNLWKLKEYNDVMRTRVIMI